MRPGGLIEWLWARSHACASTCLMTRTYRVDSRCNSIEKTGRGGGGAQNGTGFAYSGGETARWVVERIGEGKMMYLRKQINVVSGNEGSWWVAACLLSVALIAVALLTRGALV